MYNYSHLFPSIETSIYFVEISTLAMLPSRLCDQVQRISIVLSSAADQGARQSASKAKLRAGQVSASFLKLSGMEKPPENSSWKAKSSGICILNKFPWNPHHGSRILVGIHGVQSGFNGKITCFLWEKAHRTLWSFRMTFALTKKQKPGEKCDGQILTEDSCRSKVDNSALLCFYSEIMGT